MHADPIDTLLADIEAGDMRGAVVLAADPAPDATVPQRRFSAGRSPAPLFAETDAAEHAGD